MKISCATCSANYSLADEKVAGRSFKIRCRKCGAPILVRAEKADDVITSHAPNGVMLSTAMPSLAMKNPAMNNNVKTNDVMTGARAESSVLFSLDKLLGPQPTRPAPATTTEGSGLVDIRKVSVALQPKQAAKPEADLFATFASTPLAAPVLIAPPAVRRPAPLLAIVTGVSAAAVVAALASLVVVLVAVGDQNDARADVRPAPRVAVDPPVVPVAPVVPAPVAVDTPEPVAPIAEEPRVRPRPHVTVRPRVDPPRVDPRPRPLPHGEEESIEEITNQLAPRPRPIEPQAEQLPQAPARADVMRAMESVSRAVRTCGNGASGMAPTRIVFSGTTGRVTDAQVTGGTLPPEARSCIARAVRGAQLPRFSQRTFSVNYPFSL